MSTSTAKAPRKGFTLPDARREFWRHPSPWLIASTLVTEQLAACVNIIPGITSIYRWKGSVEQDQEALLLVKTGQESWQPLAERIRQNIRRRISSLTLGFESAQLIHTLRCKPQVTQNRDARVDHHPNCIQPFPSAFQFNRIHTCFLEKPPCIL